MLKQILSLLFVLGFFFIATSCDDDECQDCTTTNFSAGVMVGEAVTVEVCGEDAIDAAEALATIDSLGGVMTEVRVSCN